MINAVAEARALARKEAEKTTVFVPLAILEALLDEIDRLQGEVESLRNVLVSREEPKVRSLKP